MPVNVALRSLCCVGWAATRSVRSVRSHCPAFWKFWATQQAYAHASCVKNTLFMPVIG